MKILVLALALFSLSGCGALNATTEMNGKMDQTNSKMDDTNHHLSEVERLTKLSVGIENLMKPENIETLYPVPFGMLAWGRQIGENATTEDLARLTLLWVREINKQDPDEGCTSDDCLKKFQHKKMARYYGLWIMAGTAQQPKVEEMVKKIYYGNGEYKRAVLSFLMARASYIETFGLKEYLFSQPMTIVGELEAAFDQVSRLDYLVRLPFADKIQLKTILEDEPLVLNLEVTISMWKRLQGAFTSELNQTTIDPNSATNEVERASRADARKRAQELKKKVDSFVNSWS
jgi:hypothetical protein